MRSTSVFTVAAALAATLPANALYFYMDGNAPKCFFEELPKDTLVVGAYSHVCRNTHYIEFSH